MNFVPPLPPRGKYSQETLLLSPKPCGMLIVSNIYTIDKLFIALNNFLVGKLIIAGHTCTKG